MANSGFGKDRDRAYSQILAIIQRHIDSLPASLVTGLHAFSTAGAKDGAGRESWGLYAAGISHLKSGAPGKKPGALHEALAKASIRNSGLAAGLGISPPIYERVCGLPLLKNGKDEALFMTRRLLEGAAADLALSRRQIASGLASHSPADAFGDTALFAHDPELEKIARAARLKTGSDVPASDLAAMRKQMVLCFNFLMDAYAEAGRELKKELKTLK